MSERFCAYVKHIRSTQTTLSYQQIEFYSARSETAECMTIEEDFHFGIERLHYKKGPDIR